MYKRIRYEKKLKNSYPSDLPLAYAVLLYQVEQFERFLRAIYHPDNIYCLHVDVKAGETVRKAAESITNCFDNVFLSTRHEYIIYAGKSVLQAEINCLRDLHNLGNLIGRHKNLIGKRLIDWRYLLLWYSLIITIIGSFKGIS